MLMLPKSPWKLLAATPTMNRPVGASSTAVTVSANERLGKGSFRSGPTSVMFNPGMLGNVPGGSPAPTGGAPAGRAGGAAGAGGAVPGGGTTRGGVESGGGLNRLFEPNGVVADAPVPESSRGTLFGAVIGSGAGTSSTLEPGSCMRACDTPSPRSGIIRSPYGLSLGRLLTILISSGLPMSGVEWK